MMDKDAMGWSCGWGKVNGVIADCDNAYINERIIVNNDYLLFKLLCIYYYLTFITYLSAD